MRKRFSSLPRLALLALLLPTATTAPRTHAAGPFIVNSTGDGADATPGDAESPLPQLGQGDPVPVSGLEPKGHATSPPPRYNEATLVKVLEENGIGRPSTYAPTISTIIERKYVDKNEEKRLYPLEIGSLVNDLLVAHFPEIVD